MDGAAEDEFVIGEDDEGQEAWKQAKEPEVLLKPKYGLEGEAFDNVWSGSEPSEPPKENP